MTSTAFESEWDEIKGKVKENWGKITDSELTEIGGKKDQLLAKIRNHYGYSKDKAQEEFDNFIKKALGVSRNGNAISEGIRHFGEKAKDMSNDIADRGEAYFQKGGQINEQIKSTLVDNDITKYVKKHPLQSALISIGVGLLVGKLLK